MERSEWKEVLSQAQPETLKGLLWRVVEDQSEIATMELVETLDEQMRLEELLDATKPSYPETAPDDYLLATPFRYPPLQWGSRFGTRHEMSIFYGSLLQETAAAELAYYRFVFLEGVEEEFPNPVIRASYDLFSARFKCEPGLDLTKAPFTTYTDTLQHKANYQPTQALGSELRAAEIQGITYQSARCPKTGLNVAIFEPAGLISKKPVQLLKCYCEATRSRVVLKLDRTQFLEFPRDLFLLDGNLPEPA